MCRKHTAHNQWQQLSGQNPSNLIVKLDRGVYKSIASGFQVQLPLDASMTPVDVVLGKETKTTCSLMGFAKHRGNTIKNGLYLGYWETAMNGGSWVEIDQHKVSLPIEEHLSLVNRVEDKGRLSDNTFVLAFLQRKNT